MKDTRKRSFAVIGLGTFGSAVATELARLGDEVLGIDNDEVRVSRVADKLSHVIIADARDEAALKEAGVGSYDVAVVAIGEDLEANIFCTMSVKLLGVKCVWVKAISKTHHRILSRIGADRVIQPETEFGMHVAQSLHTPFVLDFLSLGNGYHVVNVEVPKQMAGRSLTDLHLGAEEGLRCLGVMRRSEYHPCSSNDTVLAEGDRLLLLGRSDALRRFSMDI